MTSRLTRLEMTKKFEYSPEAKVRMDLNREQYFAKNIKDAL